jgi:perosamine synthetase
LRRLQPSSVSSAEALLPQPHPTKEPTVEAAEKPRLDASKFAIGFDHRDRARLFELWTEVLDSEQWSEGGMLEAFERRWAEWNGLPSLGLASWAGGALAALEFAGVRGETVLCPSNTFMASPLAAIGAGAEVEFVDCRRDDLCMSFEDFERKAERHKPKAAILVHIGGHIAFDSERIAGYCAAEGIFLLEDCAHAHGAEWDGRRPGGFGDAGVYSLYATKTVSTGEGGVLVSPNPELVEFAAKFRNYGKFEHEVDGLNFRMSEFTAALGLVQAERMEEIVAWKNEHARERLDPAHPARLELPEGMTSGLYKYIVFEPIEKSTGRVYEQPCHRIMGRSDDLPNTDWVAENHWCVPLYYRPEGREAALDKEDA